MDKICHVSEDVSEVHDMSSTEGIEVSQLTTTAAQAPYNEVAIASCRWVKLKEWQG